MVPRILGRKRLLPENIIHTPLSAGIFLAIDIGRT